MPTFPSIVEERESAKNGLRSWWASFTSKTGRLAGGGGGGSGGGAGPTSSAGLARIGSAGLPSAASTSALSAVRSRTSFSRERKSVSYDRVFGEPLRTSLRYASVAISMAGEDGKQYVWGYVPIIVAKTGLFLKENATEIEGVFRIAGSQKRMRELQEIFDTPPKYGKLLRWEKYSVHDGASVLRRYLNQMPEPIVPLHLYNEFRNVMIKQPVDTDSAAKTYRLLIASMPPANRYLLLYVLDLLAVFARKSEVNLMPASNLAVIFQPGIFSHPSHLSDANEHTAAVEVLQFLIEHQDHFVLAISPPPPTNIDSSNLTSVSRPANEPDPDVAELSDSDEEFEQFTVHEGGGAKLMRRSTTNEGKSGKVRRHLFRFARGTPSPAATNNSSNVGEKKEVVVADDEGVVEDLGVGKQREPIEAPGEIHEVGITNDAERDERKKKVILSGVRRSRTVPSRHMGAGGEDQKRSVSAKVPAGADTAEATEEAEEVAPAATTAKATDLVAGEGTSDAVTQADSTTAESAAVEPKPTGATQDAASDGTKVQSVDPVTGLPTPPSSRHIGPAAEGGAVTTTTDEHST